jgi:sugar (pentulose or hexulose) kinase
MLLTKVRDFLSRLFPPELSKYIPGSKLVAGVILAGLAAAFGIGGDTVVSLPGIGDVSVAALALAVGVYLFPSAAK